MIGMSHRRFRLRDVLEIFLRAELELVRLGKISQRLGEAFRALLQMMMQFQPVLAQLLLEQRIKTTADAPASSMRLMLSMFSDSGEAEGTSGVRSFKPR